MSVIERKLPVRINSPVSVFASKTTRPNLCFPIAAVTWFECHVSRHVFQLYSTSGSCMRTRSSARVRSATRRSAPCAVSRPTSGQYNQQAHVRSVQPADPHQVSTTSRPTSGQYNQQAHVRSVQPAGPRQVSTTSRPTSGQFHRFLGGVANGPQSKTGAGDVSQRVATHVCSKSRGLSRPRKLLAK